MRCIYEWYIYIYFYILCPVYNIDTPSLAFRCFLKLASPEKGRLVMVKWYQTGDQMDVFPRRFIDRIHGKWHIYLHECLIFYGINVGKYTIHGSYGL